MLDPIKNILTDLFAEAKPLGVIALMLGAAVLSIIPGIKAMKAISGKKWVEGISWVGAIAVIWIIAGTATVFVLNLGNKIGDNLNQRANGLFIIPLFAIFAVTYFFVTRKQAISATEKK